mmetsp:Transcript_29382/g.64825  ORF Transcript_29382/g.64825 Transcript_29382/m.64825 type:complete len:84 (+) Transcript_29382:540-791(+)
MISAISGVHFWSLPAKGGIVHYSNEQANGGMVPKICDYSAAAAAIQVAPSINGEACMFDSVGTVTSPKRSQYIATGAEHAVQQ